MPVKQLLNAIEESIDKYDYVSIKFKTRNINVIASINDITYVNKYFFKIKTPTSEIIININQLECVELFGGE